MCLCVCARAQVSFFDPLLQQDRDVRAGRMECTMQNLADALTVRTAERLTATTPAAAAAAAAAAGGSGSSSSAGDVSEELSTFMVYNLRRKVRCCQGLRSCTPSFLPVACLSVSVCGCGRASQTRFWTHLPMPHSLYLIHVSLFHGRGERPLHNRHSK